MTPPNPRRTRWKRRAILVFVGVFAAFLMAEIAARVVTREHEGRLSCLGIALLPLGPTPEETAAVVAALQASARTNNYFIDSPTLGWSLGPSAADALGETNAQGARADRERTFAAVPPQGVIRLLTFGDSFTHGDEVPTQSTWQHQMEQLSPKLEVVNFGVPGYGVDQAYLRSKEELQRLEAQHALLCVWPEDLCRNLSTYRFLLTGGSEYINKPRYQVGPDGALNLVPQRIRSREELIVALGNGSIPLAEIERDPWYQGGDLDHPWWYASRALRATDSIVRRLRNRSTARAVSRGENLAANELALAICREFARNATARGAKPRIVLIPQRELLPDHPGLPGRELPLLTSLREAGLDVLDLSPAFVGKDTAKVFLPSGHLTHDGNAIVAAAMIQGLGL